jgi:ATP-dependent RNA helicase DDX24/MAK5
VRASSASLWIVLIFRRADQIEPDGDEDEPVQDGMQTFVFSATLSKDLQRNVKRRSRPKSAGKHYKRNDKPASTLGTSR